jgi:F420-0:gamma-glutamyl ligase
MKITGIKTRIITSADNLLALIDEYAPHLPDRSVIAVTSKIVSVCEGRIIPVTNITHEALVRQEADYYRAPTVQPSRLSRHHQIQRPRGFRRHRPVQR